MLAAGVPERVIMEILGHSRLDMTMLYSHVLPPT
jgi:site-specific recombinase XerD